jgi:anti-sigma factor RsiW
MTPRLTSRDLEILSIYLDGQLTDSERTNLESRLQVETDLQMALQEMSRTRAVLRATPVLRAPRNYTLKPEMVKVRRQTQHLYPFLRLASALASILFVLAFVGDLIFQGAPVQAPVAVVQQGVTLEAEALEEAAATEQMLMQSKAPPVPAAEPALESQLAQTATETAVTPMLMEMVVSSPEPSQESGEQSHEAGDTLREATESQTGLPALQTETPDQAENIKVANRGWWDPWRAIEIITLALAIGTGLAAIYLRRKGAEY